MQHSIEVTSRQFDCLEFIRAYHSETGAYPSQYQIAAGIHSTQNSIFMMFQKLIDKGVIHRERLWCRKYNLAADYCLKQ
jgi:Mn-dependent DtxR family transcriptional regulator